MKLEEIGVLAQRMKTGLDKLVEAEKSVNALSVELAVKEKDLAVASKEADEVGLCRVMTEFNQLCIINIALFST